jgi:hypothetical protein
MFRYLGLPPNAPNFDKETIWRKLSENKLMAHATTMIPGQRGKDALRPFILPKTPLRDLVPTQCSEHSVSLQEAYDLTALDKYLTASPHRLTNSTILQSYFERYLASDVVKRTRGKISQTLKTLIDSLTASAAKLKAMEDSAATIGATLVALGGSQPKRRKLLVKTSDISV